MLGTTILFGVGQLASLTLLHLYYTTKLVVCQEVFEKFFKNLFRAVYRIPLPLLLFSKKYFVQVLLASWHPRLLTLILYHISGQMSIVKMHKLSGRKLCKLPNKSKNRSRRPCASGSQKEKRPHFGSAPCYQGRAESRNPQSFRRQLLQRS